MEDKYNQSLKSRVYATMKSISVNNPRGVYNMTKKLQEMISRKKKAAVLRRLLQEKQMRVLMRNIKNKSCVNLMKIMVKKSEMKVQIAFNKMTSRAQIPLSRLT